MDTSLDETNPRRGTLQTLQRDVRTTGRSRNALQHRADIDFYRYRTLVDLQHWLIDETYPPVFSHPQHHSLDY